MNTVFCLIEAQWAKHFSYGESGPCVRFRPPDTQNKDVGVEYGKKYFISLNFGPFLDKNIENIPKFRNSGGYVRGQGYIKMF